MVGGGQNLVLALLLLLVDSARFLLFRPRAPPYPVPPPNNRRSLGKHRLQLLLEFFIFSTVKYGLETEPFAL